MLKLVLPKGSLEKATLDLFEAADLAVNRSSSVDYKATIDDPRVAEVRILRPQEIPRYVADGLFDLGITGRDWIEETVEQGRVAGRAALLQEHRPPDPHGRGRRRRLTGAAGRRPAGRGAGVHRVPRRDPPLLREPGIDADIRLSYGATEAKIPDIVDCIVEITETGRALRAAGLREIGQILQSYTELIANPVAYADPAKAHAMHQLRTLLQGTLEARGRVLVKLNVAEPDLAKVIALLPSLKSPTVSQLFGEGGYAVETVVVKSEINTLIPALSDAGATDIIELPISKIVH